MFLLLLEERDWLEDFNAQNLDDSSIHNYKCMKKDPLLSIVNLLRTINKQPWSVSTSVLPTTPQISMVQNE